MEKRIKKDIAKDFIHNKNYICNNCGRDLNILRDFIRKQTRNAMIYEIEKMKECITGYPHICSKDPNSCEFVVALDDIHKLKRSDE